MKSLLKLRIIANNQGVEMELYSVSPLQGKDYLAKEASFKKKRNKWSF